MTNDTAGSPEIPRKIVLLMPWGRVGSNLLFLLLQASFKGISTRFRNEPLNAIDNAPGQSAWFREYYEQQSDTEKLIASKHGLDAILDPPAVSALFEELGISYIRLRRENFVKTAVSQLRAELYAKKTEREDGRALWGVHNDKQVLPPTALDADKFIDAIRRIAEIDARFLRFSANVPSFDLTYETLRVDPVAASNSILQWLDLEPEREAKPSFKKATPDDLATAVPNLHELYAATRRAGLEEYLLMFDS